MTETEMDQPTATDELVEQRISRLSISIGAGVFKIADPEARQTFLANALIETLEDLIRRGQPLNEAASMADDIIAGARIIAARLLACSSAKVVTLHSDVGGTEAAD
jgi:hypothetical protein